MEAAHALRGPLPATLAGATVARRGRGGLHQLGFAERRQTFDVDAAERLCRAMGMILVGVRDLPGNNWSGGARTDLNRLGTWLGHGTKQCRRSNAERRGHRHR